MFVSVMNTTTQNQTTNTTTETFVFPYDIVNHWSILDNSEEDTLKVRRTLMKDILTESIGYMEDMLSDFNEKIDTIYKKSALNQFSLNQQIKLCRELQKSFLGQPSLVNEDNSLIFEELLYTIFNHCMILTIEQYMDSNDENEDYDSDFESYYIQYRDFILTYCDSSDKKNISPENVIEYFENCSESIFFDQDWAIFTPNDEVVKELKRNLNLIRK
jgi:hypothetical protein